MKLSFVLKHAYSIILVDIDPYPSASMRCETSEMSSDFHTKELQGHQLLNHRNTLMGDDPKSKIFYEKYKKNDSHYN